jgi:lipoprotein-releasing system ATP-binding protein
MTEIIVRNLTKRFGELSVLSGVNAVFSSGNSYAIIGKSGSGKSTLLNLMTGLDIPTSGEVLYNGKDLFSLDTDGRARLRNQQVGFIFQFHQLLPEFTAAENVAMPLFIRGTPEQSALASAEAILSKVGLASRVNHRPAELSGGEQQRVAVARALITEPDLVVADEPTGSLDAVTAAEVWGIIRESCRDRLLVVVTHDKELASSLDHRFEMVAGGVLEQVE